jgi:hypothetical protein
MKNIVSSMRRLVVLAVACVLAASQGASLSYAIPADYEQLPACDVTTTTYCVSEFLIAPAAFPDAFAAPPDGVTLNTYFYDSGRILWIDVLEGGLQNLSLVPPGSIAKITLHAGTTTIPSDIDGYSTVTSISRYSDTVRGNTLSITMRATSLTLALCPLIANSGCAEENWTGKTDYASRLTGRVFDTTYSSSEAKAWGQLFKGKRLASNASIVTANSFDNASQTLVEMVGAPYTKADNATVNDGSLSIFIPDVAIKVAYGANPDTLAAAGANGALTFMDTSTTSPATVTMTRMTGGVRFDFSNFTYPRRTFVLKPKKLLSKPKSISARVQKRQVTLTVGNVNKATRYQGVCIRAGTLKHGFSKRGSQTVSISRLGAGQWRCRGRGVANAGGLWSSSIPVKVRAR